MDSLVLDALRESLRHQDAIPLVSQGKRPEGKGLFPKRTKPYAQAIQTCLDKKHALLDIVREERKGKTVHHFVTINDHGLDALTANLPVEEYLKLVEEAVPDRRARLIDICLESVRRRVSQSEAERAPVTASRQRATSAMFALLTAYLNQLDTERKRLDQELADVTDVKARLLLVGADKNETPQDARKDLPDRPPRVANSEEELDYQRDVGEQLVYAWKDADTQETQDALARVLFNVGVERLGEVGQRVEFDGRWQHTEDALFPGNPAEVVKPGWRLVNQRGSFLIARARVKKAP
jgi:hypothetical protein